MEYLYNNWRLGALYSQDYSVSTDFVKHIIKLAADENMKITAIDSNYIITPDTLIGTPEDKLENITIIKPESIAAIGTALDQIITSTTEPNKETIILLTSLYVQLPYEIWQIYNYDPLYIIYGLSNTVRRFNKYRSVIIIDTHAESAEEIPYRDLIIKLMDWTIIGINRNGRIIYEKIK